MQRTTYNDSRELLAELRELLEDPHYDYSDDPAESDDDAMREVWGRLDADDRERVTVLRDALDEMPDTTRDSLHGNSWGCQMVPESEFEQHARDLAEDVGAIDADANWPACHIDWKAAAEALAQDYTSVELDGITYLCR